VPIPSEKSDTAGKPTFSTGKSAGQQSVPVKAKDPDLQFIPALVKHMALAIYKNKYGGSSDGQAGGGLNTLEGDRTSKAAPTGKNFKEAFAIARGLLTDYKHLTSGSKNGPVGKINLTSSGRIFESKHRREQGSGKKSAAFDALYMKYIAPPTDKPSGKAQEGGQKLSPPASAASKGLSKGKKP
jgi:hypothetical protein